MPRRTDRDERIAPWLPTAIAGAVTIVWCISYVADIFGPPTYSPPILLHGIFLVILAAVFGIEFVVRTRVGEPTRGNDDPDA